MLQCCRNLELELLFSSSHHITLYSASCVPGCVLCQTGLSGAAVRCCRRRLAVQCCRPLHDAARGRHYATWSPGKIIPQPCALIFITFFIYFLFKYACYLIAEICKKNIFKSHTKVIFACLHNCQCPAIADLVIFSSISTRGYNQFGKLRPRRQ